MMARLAILVGVLVFGMCGASQAMILPTSPRCFCVASPPSLPPLPPIRPSFCGGLAGGLPHPSPCVLLPMIRAQMSSYLQNHGIGCMGGGMTANDPSIAIHMARIIAAIIAREENDSSETLDTIIGKLPSRRIHSHGKLSLIHLIKLLCERHSMAGAECATAIPICKRQLNQETHSHQLEDETHQVTSS